VGRLQHRDCAPSVEHRELCGWQELRRRAGGETPVDVVHRPRMKPNLARISTLLLGCCILCASARSQARPARDTSTGVDPTAEPVLRDTGDSSAHRFTRPLSAMVDGISSQPEEVTGGDEIRIRLQVTTDGNFSDRLHAPGSRLLRQERSSGRSARLFRRRASRWPAGGRASSGPGTLRRDLRASQPVQSPNDDPIPDCPAG
jgi:hypothetical protein